MPYHTAVAFSDTIRKMGVRGGLATVKVSRHIHDLKSKEGDQGWWGGGVMWALAMTFYLRSWGCESKRCGCDIPLWMG